MGWSQANLKLLSAKQSVSISLEPTLREVVTDGLSEYSNDELFKELCGPIGSTSNRDILKAPAIAHGCNIGWEL